MHTTKMYSGIMYTVNLTCYTLHLKLANYNH